MNVRGVKRKSQKRKTPTKPDNKAQSERFIAAAKELGLDKDNPAFERAMDALVPRKRKPKDSS